MDTSDFSGLPPPSPMKDENVRSWIAKNSGEEKKRARDAKQRASGVGLQASGEAEPTNGARGAQKNDAAYDARMRGEVQPVGSLRLRTEEEYFPARIGQNPRAVLERRVASRVRILNVQNTRQDESFRWIVSLASAQSGRRDHATSAARCNRGLATISP
jgi:hypothetical protein